MTKRGEQRAVERLYRELAPAVLGYFRSHRMADPEGLTGDVFVAVAQRLGDFEGSDAALRRWVFTIAHHRRVDAVRRAVRSPEVTTDSAPEGASIDDPPLDPGLVAALGELTDDQREVVILRFVADLSIDGVADLVGRSPGAVKMLQSRALDRLADVLADTSDAPDRSPQENLENFVDPA